MKSTHKNSAKLTNVLDAIPPASCSYDQWLRIGMAAHNEGYPCEVWDEWSKGDPSRYKPGECAAKWLTFDPLIDNPVTIGTVSAIAKELGVVVPIGEGKAISWNDEITASTAAQTDAGPQSNTMISGWNPTLDASMYLSALFDDDERVSYIVDFHDDGDRTIPGASHYAKAGDLIADLNKYGDVGMAIGDNDEIGGALISVNPLDGRGRKNENVTDYRHALVECDEGTIGQQLEAIRALNLPCAAITFSGNKSVHAVVKVNAEDRNEYLQRVRFLYDTCKIAGLAVDKANKNPSRLTRFPGFVRNGTPQYLIDVDCGASSWDEWVSWLESNDSDLPPTVNLSAALADLPELAPALIDGVLRIGHKMIVSGPSKAGKTFGLIELSICIAEGVSFWGYQCRQARVLYVNLEVDERSCQHRFHEVYEAMGIDPDGAKNIDIINLRGHAKPLDELAKQIVTRARRKGGSPDDGGYALIIIDPIYKVLTGDENSASDMARFCNAIDLLCTELGCSVAYCHHHSKGAQGFKSPIDRASGSGVFARDPDAILDLSPLNANPKQLAVAFDPLVRTLITRVVADFGLQPPPESMEIHDAVSEVAKQLDADESEKLTSQVEAIYDTQQPTAWRLSATLREFASPKPQSMWFRYPVHVLDDSGVLADCRIPGEPAHKGNDADQKAEELEAAFATASVGGDTASIKVIASILGVSEKTVQRRIDAHPDYDRKNGQMIAQPCDERD